MRSLSGLPAQVASTPISCTSPSALARRRVISIASTIGSALEADLADADCNFLASQKEGTTLLASKSWPAYRGDLRTLRRLFCM